jgi:hypothetical protein
LAVGEKVTPMVQVLAGAIAGLQVLLAISKPALTLMLQKLSRTYWWLVTVTV